MSKHTKLNVDDLDIFVSVRHKLCEYPLDTEEFQAALSKIDAIIYKIINSIEIEEETE